MNYIDETFIDCIDEENNLVKKMFDLDSILDFQTKHSVQVLRGDDFQYWCYIDGEIYDTALTMMAALVFGIKRYLNKEHEQV